MAGAVDELVAKLNARASEGLRFQDNMVLRALDFPEARKKLEATLKQGYSLAGAGPVPSTIESLGQVLFRLTPPPGSADLSSPAIVVIFERSSNKLVAVSDVIAADSAGPGEFGAVPFSMAAPSFVRAAARPASDPAYARMQQRRQGFEARMNMAGPAGPRSGTPVGCWEDKPYQTTESYDTGGQKDWHNVTDHAKEWVYDDIANDVHAGPMGHPGGASVSAATGTPVGCWQPKEYQTTQSYDTGGTTDWHNVTDCAQEWVYDDIATDD